MGATASAAALLSSARRSAQIAAADAVRVGYVLHAAHNETCDAALHCKMWDSRPGLSPVAFGDRHPAEGGWATCRLRRRLSCDGSVAP